MWPVAAALPGHTLVEVSLVKVVSLELFCADQISVMPACSNRF